MKERKRASEKDSMTEREGAARARSDRKVITGTGFPKNHGSILECLGFSEPGRHSL